VSGGRIGLWKGACFAVVGERSEMPGRPGVGVEGGPTGDRGALAVATVTSSDRPRGHYIACTVLYVW